MCRAQARPCHSECVHLKDFYSIKDQLIEELHSLTLQLKPWADLPWQQKCLCLLHHSFLTMVFRLVTNLAVRVKNLLGNCNLQQLFTKIHYYWEEMEVECTEVAHHVDSHVWSYRLEIFNAMCAVRHTSNSGLLGISLIWFDSLLPLWTICRVCPRIYHTLSFLLYSWSFSHAEQKEFWVTLGRTSAQLKILSPGVSSGASSLFWSFHCGQPVV